jgi:hypothetical protein
MESMDWGVESTLGLYRSTQVCTGILLSSAALSLNFAPAETFSSTFLVELIVFENDVVI